MLLPLLRSTRLPKRFGNRLQRRCLSRTTVMSGISEAIMKDHREVEDYHNKILSAGTDKEKTQWQNQFTWELARHSIGEELVVYPQFERKLPNGQAMADKDRQEHQAAGA
ncbi:uncharacterized protein N7483_005885 [Penicillium malachiteum]|uniref:uncharacterized protein n=1 Tax=Penicillium malachiteum TaxID=1324776 RepID=UPI0025476384|nr:uncharacterized protein N7483_005885 [Penicillium malachiteum]KAJ5731377.1 hypothetical protein N7483_005885 [Penicillium malachiteum]